MWGGMRSVRPGRPPGSSASTDADTNPHPPLAPSPLSPGPPQAAVWHQGSRCTDAGFDLNIEIFEISGLLWYFLKFSYYNKCTV